MNRLFTLITFTLTLCFTQSKAQYEPQVPLTGNEGIKDDSPQFKAWASGCTVKRGWLDIADTGLGHPTLGAESDAIGEPGNGLLSLGDSGVAVVTFNHSIYNGAGPDFAVFENAFANPQNDSMAYLEFAFVEVSSDGVNFHRFPASCAMQDTAQIDNFTYTDTRFYHNLAGKYISHYGTPFDLEELKDIPGLDVNHITHIRIVDVVGSIDPLYASRDKDNRIINDPYPSPYVSGGFDLNAVGVIYSNQPPTSIHETGNALQAKVYPNPVTDIIHIVAEGKGILRYRLTDISGRLSAEGTMVDRTSVNIVNQPGGLYLMYLESGSKQSVFKINKR